MIRNYSDLDVQNKNENTCIVFVLSCFYYLQNVPYVFVRSKQGNYYFNI